MSTEYRQIEEGLIVGGRYEVGKLLRTGESSNIYSCRETAGSGGERLIIRVLHPDAMPDDPGSRSREFSFLQMLRHPNLVRVLDFGILERTGELFLIQESIEGKDLYSGTIGLSTEDVLGLITEICGVLHFLHARGIIYGNLRSSNAVLVDCVPPTIKLTGYGVGLWSHGMPQCSGYECLSYMAPEVLLGGEMTRESDMYSLGIMAYELLAKRLPFEDEDSDFLIQKHLHGSADLRPIERLKSGQETSSLIGALLEKDPLKRPSPVRVLEVLGNILGRDCLQTASKESHLSASQFVGREKEMLWLQERSRKVRETGRGKTVFIEAEAGSGKTRCMEELRSWALLEGWRVLEGTCESRKDSPYDPYRQILQRLSPAAAREIFRFGEDSRTGSSGILDASSEFAAGQFRDQLTRDLVRHLSERPTVLLLHDFHRADDPTTAVLDYLSSDIQAHPILICVGLRPRNVGKTGTLSRVIDLIVRQDRGEVLNLEPLTPDNIQDLVAGITGEIQLKALGSWIYRSVGGNPFFLEEMLKHLVEQRLLYKQSGKWQLLEENLTRLEVPAGVGIVLQWRLRQLTPSARELLNWLSLYGRSVTGRLLRLAMCVDDVVIDHALAELRGRQLIRTRVANSDVEVDFSHSLISEVIREDLSKELRRSMHRRIAEVIEQEHGTESHIHELASHHIEARSHADAVRLVLKSASRYLSEFSHENALRCFDYVFKNRDSLSANEICAAAIEASNTMFALGQSRKAIGILNSELRRNRSIGPDLKARMYMQLALSYQHLGDLRMQEACCKKGLRLLSDRHDSHYNITKANLLAELAFGEVLRSRPQRGLDYLDRAVTFCPDDGATALKGRIHGLYACLHRVGCNLRDALAECDKALSVLSGSSEDSRLVCSVLSTFGGILMALGRFKRALEYHNRAVVLSRKSRSVVLQAQALGNLTECLSRIGQVQEAFAAGDYGIRSVNEAGNPVISYSFKTILVEMKLSAGDYAGANQILSELTRNGAAGQGPSTVGHVKYLASSLHFVLGNFVEASACVDELCGLETHHAPFYEMELAKALKARIYSEQGREKKAVQLLETLDRDVTKKHWPYQMCIIKLHLAECLIKLGELEPALKYARNALRLAKGMQSVPLIGHSCLALGLIYSRMHSVAEASSLQPGAESLRERAIEQLQLCCKITGASGHIELAWKAHAELCLIFRDLSKVDSCLFHGKKAYELLCKLEDQIPSESLAGFSRAFGRGVTKLELVRIIDRFDSDRLDAGGRAAAQSQEEENARVLLRLSNAINSVRELEPLATAIVDQLIQAINAERALLFMADQATGKLHLIKARNSRQETLTSIDAALREIPNYIYHEGKPIISANPQEDPRLTGVLKRCRSYGRIFASPLRVSGEKVGVLYADHSSATGGLAEASISLFAAFCNLAAMALENARLRREASDPNSETLKPRAGSRYAEIIGRSSAAEMLRDRIALAAASPLDILITGESGTGKELVARAILRTGRRNSGSFVAVDCGSLSDNLAEAELFGYRKGAFTGAAENRQGLLEAANGGTVFLDEITNMPVRLQAKLLRVLQEREVRRIGEIAPRKVDIQVIAATNRNLGDEMRAGNFRSDLFYRLQMMEIRVPPLRERREDIPLLIDWFLQKISDQEGGRGKRFIPVALGMLKSYSYPGNIRELKNVIAGAYYSTTGDIISPDELPPEVRRGDTAGSDSESDIALRLYHNIVNGTGSFEELVKIPFIRHDFGSSVVRGVLEHALRASRGRYREAFKCLGIPGHSYSVTMQFLKRNQCYLDFRPFRSKR